MKINFLKEPKSRKESDWALVGKCWPHKTKDGALSCRFGVKTKENGKLVDVFSGINVSPDDPIMIRPNTNRRNDKDPTQQMYMLKEEAKAAEQKKD